MFDWGYAGTEIEDVDPAVEGVLERVTDGGPNAPRLPYRVSLIPDSVDAFLDEYDYVEDSQGVSPIEVERRNWEPPYTITVGELGLADRYGRPVVDGSELPEDLREFVRSSVSATMSTTSRSWRATTIAFRPTSRSHPARRETGSRRGSR